MERQSIYDIYKRVHAASGYYVNLNKSVHLLSVVYCKYYPGWQCTTV